MDPQRKRKIRLVVALSVAVLLAAALVYTSFSASTETREPSQLIGAASGISYDMTGKVVTGSVRHEGDDLSFTVADRDDPSQSIPVTYSGTIPDPFRGGREIILTGEVKDGVFLGERDTLITKCPSKFTTESPTANDS
ncbi:MAG TPA: cytochrome c maturation protein CcmE [Solirubrobacterales bacterium]